MKKLSLSILSIICTSQMAFGIFNPNWERPLFDAKMTEIDAVGHEINQGLDKVVTLQQRDGEVAPTTISFEEESYNVCIMLYMPGQSCPLTRKEVKTFKVVSAVKDGCGGVTYEAKEMTKGLDDNGLSTLRLTDHSHDICDHVVTAVWEAKISVPNQNSQNTRILKGNPTGIATIE